MNRWLFAKQIPCKLSFLYIHTKVMWLPGGQWQSLILRTSLYYSYFCVVRAATGTHTTCKVPQKVLHWNAFPRSLCEAAFTPGGILSDSLHGIKMRFPSMDKQDNVQEVTTCMGSAQGMALSACGLLQLCWLLELSQVLTNLGCITESTEHTAQSLGQPHTKWHARSEFPLLCPFSLPLSEVISFCFILILFSGTWSFAWTQSHTRLKPGCVNAPSHPALKKAQFLCVYTSMAMALSSLEAAVMAFSSHHLLDSAAAIHSKHPLGGSDVILCHHPSHSHTGVLQGPEPRTASPALVFKEHSSRGQTLSRNWISAPTLHPLNCGSFLTRQADWGSACHLPSWIYLPVGDTAPIQPV